MKNTPTFVGQPPAACNSPAAPAPLVLELKRLAEVYARLVDSEDTDSWAEARDIYVEAASNVTTIQQLFEQLQAFEDGLRELASALGADVRTADYLSAQQLLENIWRGIERQLDASDSQLNEALQRARYWRQRAKSAEGHLLTSDLHAAARALHDSSHLRTTPWDELTAPWRERFIRCAGEALGAVNARRLARFPQDSRKEAAPCPSLAV